MGNLYLSIIIPTFNRDKPLRDTLQSIFGQSFTDFEVIVADQSLQHDHETTSFLEVNKNKIRYYRLNNPGLAKAKNFAASLAQGEILLFSDDDMRFDKDFIRYHIENYANPEVSGVVSRLIVAGRQKKPFTLFGIKHVGARCSVSGRSFCNWDYDKKIFLRHCFAGPVLSLRKSVFLKTGGFDSSFIGTAFEEDMDFGCRLKRLGARMIYEPRAEAAHLFWPSGGCREPDRVKAEYFRFHNTMLYYLKHMPRIFLPYMLSVFFLIAVKKVLIPTGSKKKFFYVLSGLSDGRRAYLKDKQKRVPRKNGSPKIAFVFKFCFHFKRGFFSLAGKRHNIDFFFFGGDMRPEKVSRDTGDLWGKQLDFNASFLRGFYLAPNLRVTPSLVCRLMRGRYDIIVKCHNGRFALPASFLTAKLMRKPFILYTDFWFHPATCFHRASFFLMKFIYRHSDALFAGGEHVRKYLLSLGVRQERIFVYENTVENSLFNRMVSPAEIRALKSGLGVSDKRVILFVGRLAKEKGLDYLLEAFSGLNRQDAALLIAGEGGERGSLEKLIGKRKIDNVKFTGYIPNAELYRYYAIADLFVLASVETEAIKESWGAVINEAMNQGLPVIATSDVGAAAGGLLRHGVNGLVIPPRDTLALQEAMGQLLSDQELRQRLGKGSRETISNWSYEEKMLKGFNEAIEYVRAKAGER